MPTFVFVHRGNVKAKIRGADSNTLEQKLADLSQSIASSEPQDTGPSPVPGMVLHC